MVAPSLMSFIGTSCKKVSDHKSTCVLFPRNVRDNDNRSIDQSQGLRKTWVNPELSVKHQVEQHLSSSTEWVSVTSYTEKRTDWLKFQMLPMIEQALHALVCCMQLLIQTCRPVGQTREISVLQDHEDSCIDAWNTNNQGQIWPAWSVVCQQ